MCVGFTSPKHGHLARSSKACSACSPLPRASRWDRSGTRALSNRQPDTGLNTPSFTLLYLLGKALHS